MNWGLLLDGRVLHCFILDESPLSLCLGLNCINIINRLTLPHHLIIIPYDYLMIVVHYYPMIVIPYYSMMMVLPDCIIVIVFITGISI